MGITIKEIAELANVSSATVSKVLNDKAPYISEETKKRIFDIAKKEGYIPNAVAKSLKVKSTKTIGIIIPDVMNLFFSELARGIEDAAEKRGYSVILCNSDNNEEKEKKYIQVLQEKMVDGIILTASEKSVERSLNMRKIPMVLLDRDINTDVKVGKIFVDNETGEYEACKYLIEKGIRDIAFISSNVISKSSSQRLNGYKRALSDYGIKIDEDLIYLDSYTIETGFNGVIEILKKRKFKGICCGNDLIAIGAINALKQKQFRVPEDVKVIGFDDIQISKYINPPLTTIKQPIYQMGKEAVDMLVNMINGYDMDYEVILRTSLIERMSC
ncbi:LacI family transcriptional regulator [Soehngenia saccharolytica]|nr:LacI family transcriptional regulator [Soehngenia saccharolytica]